MSLNRLDKLLRSLAQDIEVIKFGERFRDKLKAIYWVPWSYYDRFRTSEPGLAQVLPPLNLELETNLDVEDGKFILPDTGSIGLFRDEFERWIWSYLKVSKGQSFLDVGAHVGKYTVQLARLVGESGHVIAVEPHPRNYELLLLNIRHSGMKNIAAFQVAAWKEDCALELFLGKDSGVHSLRRGLQEWHGFDTDRGGVTVDAKRLDDILEDFEIRVDWIKIDAEGAEIEVLQGLQRTLIEDRPNLVVESWKPNQENLRRLLAKFDYGVESTPSPTNFFCSPSASPS